MHMFALFLHAASASLAFMVYTQANLSTSLVFPKHQYVFTDKVEVITTFDRILTGINVPLLVFLNETLTAVSHLIAVGLWIFGWKERADSVRRWAEYAVTAGLLESAILLGMGEFNAWVHLLVLILNVIMQWGGYIIDQHLMRNEDAIMYLFTPWEAFATIFGMVLVNMMNTQQTDGKDVVEFGVLTIFYGVSYAMFGVHHTMLALRWSWYKYNVDEIFVVLSITAKIILSWVLLSKTFIGTARLGDASNEIWGMDEGAWDIVQISVSSVFFVGMAASFWLLRGTSQREKRLDV